ncbi:hypothetical protein ACGRHY_15050 [Streptomyces sp. HK10]|uniref:hypothetical protein n=1 Tax=Streptomyces sp. HK10 TaxID=3373255 RepID=UPI0037489458
MRRPAVSPHTTFPPREADLPIDTTELFSAPDQAPRTPRAATRPPARNPFQAPDFGDIPGYDDAGETGETGEPPFDAADTAKDEGPARDGGGRKRQSNSSRRRRDRSRQVRRGSPRR